MGISLKKVFNVLTLNTITWATSKALKTLRSLKGPKIPIQHGPKLQDQGQIVSTAEYGSPIPILYGRAIITGQLMDGKSALTESSLVDDNQVQYQYHYSGIWHFCAGPATAITRVWLEDELIIDVRAGVTGPIGRGIAQYKINADGSVSFLRDISDRYAEEKWHLYYGNETQLPNSLTTALWGANAANAYRGHIFLKIEDLYLVANFKNRIPTVRAEIMVGATGVGGSHNPITLTSHPTPGIIEEQGPQGIRYDKFSGNIITSIMFTSLGQLQLQGFKPGTHSDVFDVNIPQAGVGTSGDDAYVNPWMLDDSDPYIWRFDGSSPNGTLYVQSTLTGTTVIQKGTSGFTGTPPSSVIHQATPTAFNQVWVPTNGGYWRFSKSALLSGSSLEQSKIGASPIANRNPSIGQPSLVHPVPHRQWMLDHPAGASPNFSFLDSNGTPVGPFIDLSGTGATNIFRFVVDVDNDCVWYIIVDFSPVLRELYRLNLATFTNTAITSGLARRAICVDTTRSCCVVYRTASKELEWWDVNGVMQYSLNISAETDTRGDPRWLEYVADYDEVVATFEQSPYDYMIGYSIGKTSATQTTAKAVLDSISERVGISLSDTDFSAVNSTMIDGVLIDSRTSAREVLDILEDVGQFNLVMEDGKIRAKKRDTASIMTIDYTELEAEDDDSIDRPYQVSINDDLDIPSELEVAYSDVEAEYETSVQRASRHVPVTQEKEDLNIGFTLTRNAARQIADIELWRGWASQTAYTLPGTRKHWKLRAGDNFVFVDELGNSINLIATKIEWESMVSCTIEAVTNDTSVYSTTAVGGAVGWTEQVIAPKLLKQFQLLDIPIYEDSDDTLGFYVVADAGAPSATLYESTDGGITYTAKSELTEAAIGYSTTALGNFTNGFVFDELNSLTVVTYSGTLASVTDAQLLAGSNTFLVGNEIIRAGTVTPSGANTWILTHLIRGIRGTEWAISTHSSGERFVPLSTLTQRIVSSHKNTLIYYKAVRTDQGIGEAPPIAFTNTQIGKRPFSPVYIQGTRDGSLNLTGTFLRRSRLGSAWGATIDIPLGEDIEKYEVDIMSGSVVKRTITVFAPTFSYTAAEQTTDFGSAQSAILVNIYQMSSTYGRGIAGIATI